MCLLSYMNHAIRYNTPTVGWRNQEATSSYPPPPTQATPMYRRCHIKAESLAQGRALFSETAVKAESLAHASVGQGASPRRPTSGRTPLKWHRQFCLWYSLCTGNSACTTFSMNYDQFFDTTMDSKNRKMLKVVLDDTIRADQIFTILMGDEVEPRRRFIVDNALDVRNLDV